MMERLWNNRAEILAALVTVFIGFICLTAPDPLPGCAHGEAPYALFGISLVWMILGWCGLILWDAALGKVISRGIFKTSWRMPHD